MKYLKQKYRLFTSLFVGLILSFSVLLIWYQNFQKIQEAKAIMVAETGQLLSQQFQESVIESVNTLENLKSRLEVTNGDYFEYWEYDASLIIEQNPSFLLVEWIDTDMVIRRAEPLRGNEKAIGLDISELDYRRTDWEKARDDSVTNLTHWLELVQGPNAFLVDAPVYFEGQFQGTITAAMDFTAQFNSIMAGVEQYNIELKDENGVVFYGEEIDQKNTRKTGFTKTIIFQEENLNTGDWTFRIYPNQIFENENANWGLYFNLGLGLMLSLLVSVLFYFMQTAYTAQRVARNANEKIRALIDSSPMAIYTINQDGIVTDFWNKAAEEMMGWSREEVIGQFLPHVTESTKEEFRHLMNERLKEGNIRNKEVIRTRKDGSEVYLRLNVGRIVEDKKSDPQMLVTLEDIAKEKEYQKRLENSVEEKEVLLSEVHHRVKNNLAIIAGLIELQKQGLENEDLDSILSETQNRIYSIAGVHELLYNTDSFTEVTFDKYALALIDRIEGMFSSQKKEIIIDHKFETKSININQAIPLGLLLNELITNSFKHAFKETKGGKISIHVYEQDDQINAEYKDTGKGMDPSIFDSSQTLGVTLIKTLIKQLEAEYILDTQNGFSFNFTFRKSGRGSHSDLSG
ncbi:MAG: histidine kinase dimerization/phosphoacceptor domain -containing protein [Gracilimonas sp.]